MAMEATFFPFQSSNLSSSLIKMPSEFYETFFTGNEGRANFWQNANFFHLLGKFKTTEIDTLVYNLTYLPKGVIGTSYAVRKDQALFARSIAITVWPDSLRGNT